MSQLRLVSQKCISRKIRAGKYRRLAWKGKNHIDWYIYLDCLITSEITDNNRQLSEEIEVLTKMIETFSKIVYQIAWFESFKAFRFDFMFFCILFYLFFFWF